MLVTREVVPALLQDSAGRGEGDGADDVGAAALVTRRTGGPGDPALADASRRATADEVGLGGVEPVGPTGEDACAVGGVELVAGERDVVDAGGGEVDRPVRGKLRGVEGDPTTRVCAPVDSARALSSQANPSSTVRGTGRVTVAPDVRVPQGSRVEWCSEAKTTTVVSAGRVRASRFHESVVVRVKTTKSSSRAPMKRATSSRACSYHSLVTRLAKPLPRWTEA